MVRPSTCDRFFSGHCRHWELTEGAHALLHALTDQAAGLYSSGKSGSSIALDGPRLEELLADEGYAVVPRIVA